jgi:Putative Actinobacterial Holin-X, holin superfamily III
MEPLQSTPSVNELLVQFVNQTERLFTAHIRLAREEISADGRRFAVQAVGLILAGVLGIIGILFLGMAAMAGLMLVVNPWQAALLVALTFFGICGLIAYQSLQQLQRIDPTNRTLAETQETLTWFKRKQ